MPTLSFCFLPRFAYLVFSLSRLFQYHMLRQDRGQIKKSIEASLDNTEGNPRFGGKLVAGSVSGSKEEKK